jgi:hypothetical protein
MKRHSWANHPSGILPVVVQNIKKQPASLLVLRWSDGAMCRYPSLDVSVWDYSCQPSAFPGTNQPGGTTFRPSKTQLFICLFVCFACFACFLVSLLSLVMGVTAARVGAAFLSERHCANGFVDGTPTWITSCSQQMHLLLLRASPSFTSSRGIQPPALNPDPYPSFLPHTTTHSSRACRPSFMCESDAIVFSAATGM